MNGSGVYKLEWSNGYFYIGQTSSFKRRWRSHRYGFKSGHMEKHQLKLYNVWVKHGEPVFIILEECPPEQLNDVEQRYITLYWGNPLLCNTSPSSLNSRGAKRAKPPWNKGIPMTAEQRQRISQAKKGVYAGIKHPMARLTEEQVIEIRQKYVPFRYTTAQLAKEYGVTAGAIKRILNNQCWGHLPSADINKNRQLIASEGAIEFDGKAMNLRQWSKHLGIEYLTLYQRVHRYDWNLEEAFRTDFNFNQGRKLTDDQVREIRRLYAKGNSSTQLGKEYGVSHKTILGIIKGTRYASVADT